MKKYVIDASVVLTAVLGKKEKTADRLKKIFAAVSKKSAEIYAPPLILLEVANGVRFSFNEFSQAISVYEKFIKLPLNYFTFNQAQIKGILELAYDLKTTVYDTSYHYLAKFLEAVFLTCDREYYKKAKNIGNIELI